jgi:hypothetical protein
MSIWHWITVAAVVIGVALGESALESAAAAQPPIEWPALPLSFIGGSIGMAIVVGIQLMRRDEKYGRWAFRLMGPATSFFTASGVGAAGVALYSGQNGPAAWLILCTGVGMSLGLWACWVFAKRRANVAH